MCKLIKCYTLFSMLLPSVVLGQAVCNLSATLQPSDASPGPVFRRESDQCGVQVSQLTTEGSPTLDPNIGLLIRANANTVDAASRFPSSSPNLCVISLVSSFAAFEGFREEVPLVNGRCIADLTIDLFIGEQPHTLTASVEINHPDAEDSDGPSVLQVLALEESVLENCQSVSDSSDDCTSARTELSNVTGRDGSAILGFTIGRLEVLVIGNCFGRADESESCLEAREALFEATGRRGLRLNEALFEERVVELCDPQIPGNGPRTIGCLRARLALFNESGRRGFGLTRRN